ncbi:Aladin [Halotydeus destructor]|nr:Aladin [Halotydeus destructor]
MNILSPTGASASMVRTLRELNDNLEEGSTETVVFDGDYKYPSIAIDPSKILKPSIRHEAVSDAFLDKPTSVWKKAWHSARTTGFVDSLRIIVNHRFEDGAWVAKVVQKIAIFVLLLWQAMMAIYGSIFPFDLIPKDDLCQMFSHNLDWEGSLIRTFSWHPNYYRCAFAISNDDIYVYSAAHTNGLLLRHPLQRKIMSLAWMPKNEDVLAVGCQAVVVIWTIDSTATTASRVAISCSRLIDTGLPLPVTTVAFEPSGEWLVIGGPTSSKLTMVNANKSKENKVVRRFGSGYPRIDWSPDGVRMLCHTTSKYIRVFENQAWSSSTWGSDVMDDLCQASCWSKPYGRFLLVAPKSDSCVYALTFLDTAEAGIVGGASSLTKLLDFEELEHAEIDNIGKVVHDMLWDKHSERLVISFKDQPESIAVFKTRIKPTLEVELSGFIHGLPGEKASIMAFHDLFSQGSLLTICWDSGVVTHIPFQYQANKKTRPSTVCSTPRSLTNFCASPSTLPSPIGSPFDKTRIVSPRGFTFLASDTVVTLKKPTIFSRLQADR